MILQNQHCKPLSFDSQRDLTRVQSLSEKKGQFAQSHTKFPHDLGRVYNLYTKASFMKALKALSFTCKDLSSDLSHRFGDNFGQGGYCKNNDRYFNKFKKTVSKAHKTSEKLLRISMKKYTSSLKFFDREK